MIEAERWAREREAASTQSLISAFGRRRNRACLVTTLHGDDAMTLGRPEEAQQRVQSRGW